MPSPRSWFLCTVLLLFAAAAQAQHANWLTAIGPKGDVRPVSVQVERMERADGDRGATFLVDLAVSLYKKPLDPDFPSGDGDGNAQGFPLSEQDRYEIVFQHFADAIYEATDGAHKIRRVRIFDGGRHPPGTGIVWQDAGQPNVLETGGVLVSGSHVNMYDLFVNALATGDADLIETPDGRQLAGYLLAHLWMRYFYGAGAEYLIENDDIPVAKSLMNNPFDAVTFNDPSWLNVSAHRDGLEPFEDHEHTRATQQHRLFYSSMWETLSRDPVLDPKSGELWARPPRLYFPALALTAPVGDAPPATNLASLPGTAANSRSDLEIIWVADFLMPVLVLDVSGSMAGEKIENMKAAAQLLVDTVADETTKMGIVTFTSTAELLYPITVVTPESRAAMRAAIEALVPLSATAMGDGARLALNQMLANGAEGCIPVAFILSDGQTNSGEDPATVIPDYQAAQIPMFTFAYGEDADVGLMEQMATDTGGEFFLTPSSLEAVAHAFSSAGTSASGVASLIGERVTLNGSTRNFTIPVDTSLKRLDVTAVFDRPGGIAQTLRAPNQVPVAPTAVTTVASGTIVTYVIYDPAPGDWRFSTTGFVGSVNIMANGIPDGDTLRLSVSSVFGDVLEYPTPIVLQANLTNGLPVVGATVEARITRPAGQIETVSLHDDGVSPDLVAHDGRYSATVFYGADGVHQFDVTANGISNLAAFTHRGTLFAPGVRNIGATALPEPPNELISEDFSRHASLRVSVSGVVSDDHGDLAQEATPILPDNHDIPGVINRMIDTDFFTFVVTPALANDTIVIRVSGFGRGFSPNLLVYDPENPQEILEDVTVANSITPAGYLAVPLTAPVGTQITFAVMSADLAQVGGVYSVSAGPFMPGDVERAESGGGGGGGGGCFIATAAYGTPMAAQLHSLREFRDRQLLESSLGAAFTDLYYRLSPALAQRLAESAGLRVATRVVLAPMVWLIEQPDAALIIAVEIGMLAIVLVLASVSRRRLRRERETLV